MGRGKGFADNKEVQDLGVEATLHRHNPNKEEEKKLKKRAERKAKADAIRIREKEIEEKRMQQWGARWDQAPIEVKKEVRRQEALELDRFRNTL